MRVGHYEAKETITLDEGRLADPSGIAEALRVHALPGGMTDEELFCLTFFDFSRSIKVALLDRAPFSPQEIHARGESVWRRLGEERSAAAGDRAKRRKKMNGLIETSNELYRAWVDGRLSEIGWDEAALLKELDRRNVSLDHAPEPYLVFDEVEWSLADKPRLVFLTTNPGGPQDYQSNEDARGFANYDELQKWLVREKYRKGVLKGAALTRIERMREIAGGLPGNTGFVQCECVPFHSQGLPNKRGLAKWLRGDGAQSALGRYQASLSEFLKANHVIALDASNSPTEARFDAWPSLKGGLFDFDPAKSNPTLLGRSPRNRPSSGFYAYQENGLLRGYYLTQGGNDFRKHTSEICEAIRKVMEIP